MHKGEGGLGDRETWRLGDWWILEIRRAAIAMLAVFLALVAISQAQARAGGTAELYKVFGITKQHAHYVIAVDTSLSMTERFKQVGPALKVLTTTMQTGDRVSVVGFDKKPRLLWSGKVGSGNNKLLLSLPRQANRGGTSTDIGAALDKIITRAAVTPEGLQVVFFLTDGRDEPPQGSKFSGSGRGSSWAALRGRALRISGKLIKVYGIGLDSGNTDVDILKTVFADAGRVSMKSSRLSAYFTSLKSELRRERLKVAVKHELAAGVVGYSIGPWPWQIDDDGKASGSIEISSNYRKLAVRVERLRLRLAIVKTGGRVGATRVMVGRSTVIVPPRGRVRVPVSVIFQRKEGSLRLGKRRLREQVPLVAGADVSVQPATAISALGLSRRAKVSHERLLAHADSFNGMPYTYVAAAGLVALLIGAAVFRMLLIPGLRLLRRWSGPPPLSGRLVFLDAPAGERPPSPVCLSGKGSKVSLGTGAQVILPTLAGRVGAELYTKWDGNKQGLVLRRLSGSIRVRQARYQAPMQVLGEFDLKKGSIIELGGYKIQWL